ncbi:hypothetical protein EIP91_000220 [Steccherinum ochraceum]|uniref:AB hydrolase-1 domain-containing protein n=1 Tax=Steccherinum ochraceum TaxID=92696 RepID=A0A4R0RKC3_9APHY|nr:hypothetical protein EIP91_000220 [Steccherinum ochraceum]
MELRVDEYSLTGTPAYGGLRYCFKRYCNSSLLPRSSPGMVLLLMHGIGSHKESWEPVLEHLFTLEKNSTLRGSIKEAWCMDSPNHGQGAIWNDAILEKISMKSPHVVHGWHMLLSSGLMDRGTVIAIGHSAGSICLTLATNGFPLERLPFSHLILVEPVMIPRQLQIKTYALRDLPTETYPNEREGVTLSTPRMQEAVGYLDHEAALGGFVRFSEICSSLPVHCIYGERQDLITDEQRDAIHGEHIVASVATVAGAGHMIPQEDPEGLAQALWTVMKGSVTEISGSRL